MVINKYADRALCLKLDFVGNSLIILFMLDSWTANYHHENEKCSFGKSTLVAEAGEIIAAKRYFENSGHFV